MRNTVQGMQKVRSMFNRLQTEVDPALVHGVLPEWLEVMSLSLPPSPPSPPPPSCGGADDAQFVSMSGGSQQCCPCPRKAHWPGGRFPKCRDLA